MWVLAGNNGGIFSNDAWYSSDGISWSRAIAPAPWLNRVAAGALVFDNRIWLLGGTDGGYLADIYNTTGGARLLEIKINVSFRTQDGRIIGGDTNFNGIVDGAETTLDSPVAIRFFLSDKRNEIFFGRS
jgi:hypothetical protein